MNIIDEKIALTNKEKAMLIYFFDNNRDYLKNSNLYKYEDVKLFADLYELYLKDNKLDENDKLKLFLAELRLLQLELKITQKCNRIAAKRQIINITSMELPEVIDKWLHECKTEEECKQYILKCNIEKKAD